MHDKTQDRIKYRIIAPPLRSLDWDLESSNIARNALTNEIKNAPKQMEPKLVVKARFADEPNALSFSGKKYQLAEIPAIIVWTP